MYRWEIRDRYLKMAPVVVRSLSCKLHSCCDSFLKSNYYKKSTLTASSYCNFSSR